MTEHDHNQTQNNPSTNIAEEHETQQKRYEVFLEERKYLIGASKEASTQYAKGIMTLAAGALALSITFIKDIVPSPNPQSLDYLKASWFLFAGSLSSVVVSFFLAQFAMLRQVDVAKSTLLPDSGKGKRKENVLIRWIICFNVLSLAGFLLGVVLLVMFSSSNLENKRISQNGAIETQNLKSPHGKEGEKNE